MVPLRKLALSVLMSLTLIPAARAENKWENAGWGGGGFFYSAAFDPSRDGVFYLGGDVNGAYKTTDNGKTWRIINNGIAAYGVFSLAVDPSNPDTVWAATDDGLSKSTDGGETWQTIRQSGPKELRLTGEKNRSTHNIAIHPTDGNAVFVGTPHGKIYKTADGDEAWTLIYESVAQAETKPSVQFQFGKVNSAIFGGIWSPLTMPTGIDTATAIGLSIKVEGGQPRDGFFTLKTSDGISYRSRNLHDDFTAGDWRDLTLAASDFAIDPQFSSKEPDKAAAAPKTPDWTKVNRFDLSFVGGVESAAMRASVGEIFFVTPQQPRLVTFEGGTAKTVGTYGNISVGKKVDGPIFSVAISPKDPQQLAAASADKGLLLSNDGGTTWQNEAPMKRAVAVAFAPSDANVVYTACMDEGVWKSVDKGKTWTKISNGISEKAEVRDIVVSPKDPNVVAGITSEAWNGSFIATTDGGQTWRTVKTMTPDPVNNPTLSDETASGKQVAISAVRNIAMNPRNPDQLFIAGNWRNLLSSDGGQTWTETAKGADITCVGDIRFHEGAVYASAMDEGVLVSRDNGATWKQLWPKRHNEDLSGHYWRLDVRQVDGNVRILSAASPWSRQYNQVVLSKDDGTTFAAHRKGLPDYLPTANTMWGRAYARALAVDPADPKTVYLGIDGDATPGKSGGGVFKSTDGGETWSQLPGQPASRRMFFGLAVDPTESKRLYWGACADRGGLYRSEDGGQSWEHVFKQESWIFNLHVTNDGTVYCLGKRAYRSTDHGKTWQPLAAISPNPQATIVGFEAHPSDPNTMWASCATWGIANAPGTGVFKTTDGGKTWTDITGNLPYRKPLVLRFNPATNELWAGFVGLYRIRQ